MLSSASSSSTSEDPLLYSGDDTYPDDITSGPADDQDDELELLHQGVECALCTEPIEDEDDGESSPYRSVHAWCATMDERNNPDMW